MKNYLAPIAVIAAVLTFSASLAFAEPGKPIQGTEVGLDHEPPGPNIYAHARTNDAGDFTVSNLKAGTYTFKVMDASSLKVPCRLVVTHGREKLRISQRILPNKRAVTAYAVDSNGHKLAVVVDKPGGSITVHLQTDN